MKLYVISGVAGMTGSELASVLLNRGEQVIGFDNFFASSFATIESIKDHVNFDFFKYDLCNLVQMDELCKYVRKQNYDELLFVNCAAIVHTEHFYEIESTYGVNVMGMRSFLEMGIELNASVYINCSTSEVYSMQSFAENGGVKESDFLVLSTAEHSQRTSYATGKLLTEFFMKDAVDKDKIRGCSIRFANVYSSNELYPKHIIPHIFSSLKKSNEVTLLENSKINRRSFLHNIDSCAAVLALMDTPCALDGTVYNVATDEEITMVELAHKIACKMGIDNLKIRFEGYRSADPIRRVLNCDKLKTRTLWEPKVSLDMGLDLCLNK